ncbi:MAG TPA: RNase adapter RapZ [Clostridiaceae bacterium]|jgi:UPF0042 nucleotide-binding protein|nr:RNase adapter RapZ [Clostridiaceae bacterium]HBF77067.1 RNase adapter RapZ [Clostridiaceae bacterium]HBG38203.1 RNase adapter RapZ [Clostridiaceae bacterium]HBN28714.1 RNase adapter RapZ [Clostridiaceae bacterium]HBX47429.1 RNase adapter RapZ [Clostridiaceae bacterium]
MEFVIVTGLSGAGKTQAIRSLEDMGYFCIDNLPPALLSKFAEICCQSNGKIEKVAVVVDIRGGKFFDDFFGGLNDLKVMGNKYQILFIDASDEVLVKRYKESRRNHPLAIQGRIINGIREERQRLEEVKRHADHIIDTTNLTSRQLKEEMQKIFLVGEEFDSLIINVISFGFKYGIPLDSDLVFDVRFLPNPYYIKELKKYSGNDDKVKEYVFKWPETMEFINKVSDLLQFLIPLYIKEGKNQLVISIGCTGGRHRSVAIANKIFEILKEQGHAVFINHRDISKDVMGDVNE